MSLFPLSVTVLSIRISLVPSPLNQFCLSQRDAAYMSLLPGSHLRSFMSESELFFPYHAILSSCLHSSLLQLAVDLSSSPLVCKQILRLVPSCIYID